MRVTCRDDQDRENPVCGSEAKIMFQCAHQEKQAFNNRLFSVSGCKHLSKKATLLE